MNCVVKLPSDFKFIVSSYDIEDIVKHLKCPITVLDVEDDTDDDRTDKPGYFRTMITIYNPNCKQTE